MYKWTYMIGKSDNEAVDNRYETRRRIPDLGTLIEHGVHVRKGYVHEKLFGVNGERSFACWVSRQTVAKLHGNV